MISQNQQFDCYEIPRDDPGSLAQRRSSTMSLPAQGEPLAKDSPLAATRHNTIGSYNFAPLKEHDISGMSSATHVYHESSSFGCSQNSQDQGADASEQKPTYECCDCGKRLCSPRSLKRHRNTCKRVKTLGDSTPTTSASNVQKMSTDDLNNKDLQKAVFLSNSNFEQMRFSNVNNIKTEMQQSGTSIGAILSQQSAQPANSSPTKLTTIVADDQAHTGAIRQQQMGQQIAQSRQQGLASSSRPQPMPPFVNYQLMPAQYCPTTTTQSPNSAGMTKTLQPDTALTQSNNSSDNSELNKVSDVVDSVVAKIRSQSSSMANKSASNAANMDQKNQITVQQHIQHKRQQQQFYISTDNPQLEAKYYPHQPNLPHQLAQQREFQMSMLDQSNQKMQQQHLIPTAVSSAGIVEQQKREQPPPQFSLLDAPKSAPMPTTQSTPIHQFWPVMGSRVMPIQAMGGGMDPMQMHSSSSTPQFAVPNDKFICSPPPYGATMPPQPMPLQPPRKMKPAEESQPQKMMKQQTTLPSANPVSINTSTGSSTSIEMLAEESGGPTESQTSKNIYRYLCPECDKPYSCRKNVKRHRINQHKVSMQEAQDGYIKRIRLTEAELQQQQLQQQQQQGQQQKEINKVQLSNVDFKVKQQPDEREQFAGKNMKPDNAMLIRSMSNVCGPIETKNPMLGVQQSSMNYMHPFQPGGPPHSAPLPNPAQSQQHFFVYPSQYCPDDQYGMGTGYGQPIEQQQPQYGAPLPEGHSSSQIYHPQQQQQPYQTANAYQQNSMQLSQQQQCMGQQQPPQHQHQQQQEQRKVPPLQYANPMMLDGRQHLQQLQPPYPAQMQEQLQQQQQIQKFQQKSTAANSSNVPRGPNAQMPTFAEHPPYPNEAQQFGHYPHHHQQMPPPHPQQQQYSNNGGMAAQYQQQQPPHAPHQFGHQLGAPSSSSLTLDAETLECWEQIKSGVDQVQTGGDAAAFEMARILEDIKRTEQVTEYRQKAKVFQQQQQQPQQQLQNQKQEGGFFPFIHGIEAQDEMMTQQQLGIQRKAVELAEADTTFSPPSQPDDTTSSSSASRLLGGKPQQKRQQFNHMLPYGQMVPAESPTYTMLSAQPNNGSGQMFNFDVGHTQLAHQKGSNQTNSTPTNWNLQVSTVQSQPAQDASRDGSSSKALTVTNQKKNQANAAKISPTNSNFVCPACSKGYSTDYSLKRHRQVCPVLNGKEGANSGNGTRKRKNNGNNTTSTEGEGKGSKRMDDSHNVDPDSTMNESPPEESRRTTMFSMGASGGVNGDNNNEIASMKPAMMSAATLARGGGGGAHSAAMTQPP